MKQNHKVASLNEEQNLTEFDNKMINEMKAIPQFKEWTDQQLADYCHILKCYSKLIIKAIMKNKEYNEVKQSTFTITSQHKQVA